MTNPKFGISKLKPCRNEWDLNTFFVTEVKKSVDYQKKKENGKSHWRFDLRLFCFQRFSIQVATMSDVCVQSRVEPLRILPPPPSPSLTRRTMICRIFYRLIIIMILEGSCRCVWWWRCWKRKERCHEPSFSFNLDLNTQLERKFKFNIFVFFHACTFDDQRTKFTYCTIHCILTDLRLSKNTAVAGCFKITTREGLQKFSSTVFGGHTCPFVGPLVPLFWISCDVSSGVQSQSGFCLIHFLRRWM